MLLLVAAGIYVGVAIALFPVFTRKISHLVEPRSTARAAGLRKSGRGVFTTIGFLLVSLAWPLIIISAAGWHFLLTPGYTCCGLTFAKQPPQQQPSLQQHQSMPPAPPTPRSNEHNMEAGLLSPALQAPAPAEIVSVAPTAPRPINRENNLEASLPNLLAAALNPLALNPVAPALQAPAEIVPVAPPAAPRSSSDMEEHNLEAWPSPAPPALQSPDMEEFLDMEEMDSEPPPVYMRIGPEGLPPLYDDLVVDVA